MNQVQTAIMIRKGILSIIFWSIISAAFIGPGTVTTAALAGSVFGLDLLWAVAFSTIACIVLQESAARVKIGSGLSLGEALALRYSSNQGFRVRIMVAATVIFGCAAYQAGNILGSVAGSSLILDIPTPLITTSLVLICGTILWFGNYKWIANFLGAVVAIMGVSFVTLALHQEFTITEILGSSFIPTFPENSSLLVVSLVGTTIVPYNLFLASGISQSQSLLEMRFGMAIAILLGGLISMAVLISGTSVLGAFSFEALALAMNEALGEWAGIMVGIGLFAAGFTSCLTAPLASAVTAQSMFNKSQNWHHKSRNYRMVWGAVLIAGFGFRISGVQPIPAIIFAQALNGVLLPIVAIFLVITMNDQVLLTKKFRNNFFSNLISLIVVWAATLIGLINISKALGKILNTAILEAPWFFKVNLGLAVLITIFTIMMLLKQPTKTENP